MASPSPPPLPIFPVEPAALAALDAALTTGATRVHYQDRTVDYANAKDLLIARTLLYNLLYTAGTPGPNGTVTRRQTRMCTSTGW